MSTGARTNVGVSYPTKLRATLRAPPSKWAIGAFFPEGSAKRTKVEDSPEGATADRSPRRIAGRAARVAVPLAFFGTFFRFERKYCPPQGGSPTVRAVVGASDPRGRRYAPAGAPKGFPRGKQSARFALPCAPLVVCLNDRSLTAFGGCIHWIPASLRSPLETFGHRSWRENHGTAVQRPHRSRRINPPEGKLLQ